MLFQNNFTFINPDYYFEVTGSTWSIANHILCLQAFNQKKQKACTYLGESTDKGIHMRNWFHASQITGDHIGYSYDSEGGEVALQNCC